MINDDRGEEACPDREAKRFRSTKAYNEQKKQRKAALASLASTNSGDVSGSSSESDVSLPQQDYKTVFAQLLKDSVCEICSNWFQDDTRKSHEISTLIRRTLMDKEYRMPEKVRFRISDERMNEAARKRIAAYTGEYLARKYPRRV